AACAVAAASVTYPVDEAGSGEYLLGSSGWVRHVEVPGGEAPPAGCFGGFEQQAEPGLLEGGGAHVPGPLATWVVVDELGGRALVSAIARGQIECVVWAGGGRTELGYGHQPCTTTRYAPAAGATANTAVMVL